MLRHLCVRRFGAAAGKHVARLVARIDDPVLLDEVGQRIIDCDEAGDLIAQLEALLA